MKPTLESISRDALGLGYEERLELTRRLVRSMTAPPLQRSEEELWAEVERRAKEIDDGTADTIPWEVVRERLRAKIESTQG